MQTTKGLTTEQAFKELLDDKEVEIEDRQVLKYREKNGGISLEKKIKMLEQKGWKRLYETAWTKSIKRSGF